MQLGAIGLGRMGANMAARLMRADHECIVYDSHPEPVQELVGGEPEIVQHLDPIFRALAPGVAAAPRTPGATGEPKQAECGNPRIKHPGEGMEGQDVELILTEQESAFMPPYQLLLGDAMHGIGDLFGRQDIVDAQRRIVEPVLDDVVLPVTYEQGSRGPEEANELIGPDGPWHNPKPAAMRP